MTANPTERSALVLALGGALGLALGSCDRDDGMWQPDPQLCTSSDALTLFERRIEPLLVDDNPSTCNQCHLSGIDLGLYAQGDECQTMACLVDQSLVDLDDPDRSIVLSWIDRAAPDGLITADVIADERQGVLDWIRYHASCPEACPETYDAPCGEGPLAGDCELPPSGHDAPPRPFDDPGDCSDLTLERGFAELVYSWRGRCFPCHFSGHDGKPEDAPRWIIEGDCNAAALATMRGVVEHGYLDFDDPSQSLLLLKPLAEDQGGVEHGGQIKFIDKEDPSYRDYLRWIERYVACNGGG